MSEVDKTAVLWSREFILLIIVDILTNMGFGMLLTSVSYYAVENGASLSYAGMMASVFSLVAMVTRPFGGRLFDRFNKKRAFIISTLAFGCISGLYALATDIHWLLTLRIVHGVAFSLSGVTNMALIACFIPKSRMNEGIGYYSAGMFIGQAIAPPVAEPLMGSIGFFWLYIIVALMIVLPLGLCVGLRVPEQRPENAPAEKKKFVLAEFLIPGLILFMVVNAIFSFYNGIANAFIFLVGKERQIENIGLFFTVNSIVLFLTRVTTGKLADKVRMSIMVNSALAVSIVSLLLMSRAALLPIVMIAAAFKALGQGVGQVVLNGESVKQMDAVHVGAAVGMVLMGNDLGNTLGPIAGGFVSQHWNYATMFVVSAMCFAVMMVVFNVCLARRGQQQG